jgi:hypothetical protein
MNFDLGLGGIISFSYFGLGLWPRHSLDHFWDENKFKIGQQKMKYWREGMKNWGWDWDGCQREQQKQEWRMDDEEGEEEGIHGK